jgi:hypothetical protein
MPNVPEHLIGIGCVSDRRRSECHNLCGAHILNVLLATKDEVDQRVESHFIDRTIGHNVLGKPQWHFELGRRNGCRTVVRINEKKMHGVRPNVQDP